MSAGSRGRSPLVVFVVCSGSALSVLGGAACGSSGAVTSASFGTGAETGSTATSATTSTSGTGGAPEMTLTLHPNQPPLPGQAACTVVETSNIPEPDFNHLPMCTPVTYATDPPSGGNHWPIWAAYKIYAEAVPREMSVHCLEHGAIVMSYDCPSGCPDVVAALTQVFQAQADPLCLMTPGGPPARMVITPDSALPTPITAAAWGATYTATCIDIPSLQAFVAAHYNHGREDLCNDGQDTEADPPCPDAGTVDAGGG